MADRVDLEYNVQVTGLGEAAASANSAAASASQASAALQGVQAQGGGTMATMAMTLRTLNSTRLAVTQTSRAINDLNPVMLLTSFMSMIHVVSNLTSLTRRLRESTAAASAAQAILTTLSGQWWLIPLAIAAGALVYSRIQSMQVGGPVASTGLYLLHRGEYVVPASQTHLGPIFVTFERQPSSGLEVDQWLRELGPRLEERMRRGS
ncbi:MAG TPA: hypothetical protein VMW22_07990 [Candidatus Desulfaltia sp.]|nr:hypothetical protein [Candidatus Desulfaltia sp.]